MHVKQLHSPELCLLFAMKGARKDQTAAPPGRNFPVCRHGDAQRAAFVTLATHDYSQGALVLTVGLWWGRGMGATDSLDGNLFFLACERLVYGLDCQTGSMLLSSATQNFLWFQACSEF